MCGGGLTIRRKLRWSDKQTQRRAIRLALPIVVSLRDLVRHKGGSMDMIDRASVFRQRRFLLAATFALVAFYYFHASLSDEIETAIVTLKHSTTRFEAGVVLWLIWIYSAVRYRQYESTFRNDALQEHRARVMTQECLKATTAVIQRGVREGLYESRGVGRERTVEVSISPEGTLLPLLERNQWRFPNMTVRIQGGGDDWQWLDGGANCTLDAVEARTIAQRVDKRLRVEFPHFTDFKVPYYLALLAPAALIYDFVHRWFM